MTGTQVLPTDKMLQEKWSNFPNERKRLLDTIRNSGREGVIILSGDVHYSELMSLHCKGVTNYPLFEFTSSGISHSCCSTIPLSKTCYDIFTHILNGTYNRGFFYPKDNFGVIDINWEQERETPSSLHLKVFSSFGDIVHHREIEYKELTFKSTHNYTHNDCLSVGLLYQLSTDDFLIFLYTSLYLFIHFAVIFFFYFFSRFS